MPRKRRHLLPGDQFPSLTLDGIDGSPVRVGQHGAWTLLLVYRGAHCSICKKFFHDVEKYRQAWKNLGIETIAACSDSASQVKTFLGEAGYQGPGAGGLTIGQMRELGVWITDVDQSGLSHGHPEPALFFIDPEGRVAAAQLATIAFFRPDLATLDMGLKFLVGRNIRPPYGRYQDVVTADSQLKTSRVLLTGATGHVGSVIAAKLNECGTEVIGTTRRQEAATNLETAGISPRIGDINDIDFLREASLDVDAIIHTALPSKPAEGEDMAKIVNDAVAGLENLAKLSNERSVRVVSISGVSIYGDAAGKLLDEKSPPMVPEPFLRLVEAEQQLAEQEHACVIRSAIVYGRGGGAGVTDIVEGVKSRGAAGIVNGQNRLSMVHVDDLAQLFLLVLQHDSPPNMVNGVSAQPTSKNVMEAVAVAADVPQELEQLDPQEAMMLGGFGIYLPIDQNVSGNLARSSLDWNPSAPSIIDELTFNRVSSN